MFKFTKIDVKFKPVHVLIDPETTRVACASNRLTTINSLRDGKHILGPKYNINATIDPNFDSTCSWEWCLMSKHILPVAKFAEANKVPLKYEMLEKFQLISMQAGAIDYIVGKLTGLHKSLQYDLPLQETTYLIKYEQAKRVLAGEDDIMEVPMVWRWADLRSISITQAAKEIKFKFEDTAIKLMEAEDLRQRYTHLIKKQVDAMEIPSICHDFDNENSVYSKV
jgi:hypothetical protein